MTIRLNVKDYLSRRNKVPREADLATLSDALPTDLTVKDGRQIKNNYKPMSWFKVHKLRITNLYIAI